MQKNIIRDQEKTLEEQYQLWKFQQDSIKDLNQIVDSLQNEF